MNDINILIILSYGLFILLWSGFIILYWINNKSIKKITLKQNQTIHIEPEDNSNYSYVITGGKQMLYLKVTRYINPDNLSDKP